MREMHSTVAIELAPLPAGLAASVITDKHWLTENVLCLLSNAVKYSDGGPIRVEIALRPIEQSAAAGAFTTSPQSGLSVAAGHDHVHGPGHGHTISAHGAPAPALAVRVTIVDCGIGVPPESRGRLFQPFGQTQRRAGGTGLGLYRHVCGRPDAQSQYIEFFPSRLSIDIRFALPPSK
jgi:signal transduction histidine kinase